MTTIDFGTLQDGFNSADAILARAAPTDLLRDRIVSDALTRLDEIDASLARLVFDPGLTARRAAQIGRIRDDLGGYWLAATAMQEIAMPAVTVANVLQRGVDQAKRGLFRLSENDLQPYPG